MTAADVAAKQKSVVTLLVVAAVIPYPMTTMMMTALTPTTNLTVVEYH